MNQPYIRVGIMSAENITLAFHGAYLCGGKPVQQDKPINFSVNTDADRCYVCVSPDPDECWFEVRDVTIGIGFHWQRQETQRFRGDAELLRSGDRLVLVNRIGAEEYLKSVISSEMSAGASAEFLKAHAVISRSWLMAQIQGGRNTHARTCEQTADSLIRWYDHTDHDLFDVCADDHCQRYQGITRQTTPTAEEAVRATAGEVLMCGDELVDARFSKCCGGAFEEFENCWEPVHHPYLEAGRDLCGGAPLPDLSREEEAERWIESRPDAFCARATEEIIAQVLNGYDRETEDFYRWQLSYSAEELSELVHRRTGMDFGIVTDLIPLERGTSGRIVRLRIVGTRLTMTIGKELEIRRSLSESHLYSSAFTVARSGDRFVLRGAGWGHGVGLCQIGAAVMGAEGYSYREILLHYFKNTEIRRLYGL